MNNINFFEGTIVIRAKVNQSPTATTFKFLKYDTSEGEISLEIKNKTELTFTHIYKGKTNKVITDYTYFFDKDISIAATWSLTSKELNLYINGEFKKKVQMDNG